MFHFSTDAASGPAKTQSVEISEHAHQMLARFHSTSKGPKQLPMNRSIIEAQGGPRAAACTAWCGE